MNNRYERCPNCMSMLEGGEAICPNCGFNNTEYEDSPKWLPPFTILQNKYMIGRVIGEGGFGITYKGWDLNLQTYIAIKEYFPDSFASRECHEHTVTVVPHVSHKETYQKGLNRYVEEARNLSKFYDLGGIVSVKDFFYENGTGYIVMEYIDGINLMDYLKNNGGSLSEDVVLYMFKPVFESLLQVHDSGLIHRDISPDNIMVTTKGKIKLIDFGSVRENSLEQNKTYTVMLKHGYAPPEQYYGKGRQGSYTDIYGLCATMYKMLTGKTPPNSIERMEEDTYRSPSELGFAVSQTTEKVLRKGLAIKCQDRYQNINELINDLYGGSESSAQTVLVNQNMPSHVLGYDNNGFGANQQQFDDMRLVDRSHAKQDKKFLRCGIAIIALLSIVLLVLVAVLVINNMGGSDKDKEPDYVADDNDEKESDDEAEEENEEENEESDEEDESEKTTAAVIIEDTEEIEDTTQGVTEAAEITEQETTESTQEGLVSQERLQVINCSEYVTLREYASVLADEVQRVPLGSYVALLEISENGFYKVSYNGFEGYVLGSYLTAPEEYPYETHNMYVANCEASITLRKTPAIEGDEIMQIPLNAQVTFYCVAENEFYFISYNGVRGFALAEYLE